MTDQDYSSDLAEAFIGSVLAVKALDWLDLGKDRQGFLSKVSQLFVTDFAARAVGILLSAAASGKDATLADYQVSLPAGDWDAVSRPWADSYALAMATEVSLQSHRTVDSLLPALENRGMRDKALADSARTVYGLDPRSGASWYAFLASDKKPTNRTATDLAQDLLAGRAKIIGDVQGLTGINFGRQLTYMVAQQNGMLPRDAKKVWVTAIDERVCPVCRPMDGVAVPINSPFEVVLPDTRRVRGQPRSSVKALTPPVHINCRCTIVSESVFRQGIITRTARFGDDENHRGRLASEVKDLIFTKNEPVEKFNPLQYRDALGRFAAVGAAAGAGAYAFQNYPKVSPTSQKLPRHLNRIDRKVHRLRSGTYLIPRQYLDFHRRGQSFRFGNEGHVEEMARVMRNSGYQGNYKPVTLHVWDNAVDIADGNHRVEAAYRAKVGHVPTRVVRHKGSKPAVAGVIPAWREHRTTQERKQIAQRYAATRFQSPAHHNRFARAANIRLISQDERRKQWHQRQQKIKPLP